MRARKTAVTGVCIHLIDKEPAARKQGGRGANNEVPDLKMLVEQSQPAWTQGGLLVLCPVLAQAFAKEPLRTEALQVGSTCRAGGLCFKENPQVLSARHCSARHEVNAGAAHEFLVGDGCADLAQGFIGLPVDPAPAIARVVYQLVEILRHLNTVCANGMWRL